MINIERLTMWTLNSSKHKLFAAVILLASLGCQAQNVSKELFGLHIHRADGQTPWPAPRFGSWRLWDSSVQWPEIQPSSDKWDFKRLDLYVAMAEINNISILLPLGLTPSWATTRPTEPSAYGPGKAAPPSSMESWRNYVRSVAERYRGRIKAYEIWNEPNNRSFFSGTKDDLIRLTCEAYKVLKAVDPEIMVVSPAYTGEQNVPVLENFLSSGGKNCIDIVSYHLYVTLSQPEAIVPLIKAIREAMVRQGISDLPLWNTESGWAIENTDGTPLEHIPDYWLRVSSSDSASFVARTYLLASAFNVNRFYWYAWDNKSMGLIDPTTKALKPGGTAYGTVANWLVGRPRPQCIVTDSKWVCTSERSPIERTDFVWSSSGISFYLPPHGWKISNIERADGKIEKAHDFIGRLALSEIPYRVELKQIRK